MADRLPRDFDAWFRHCVVRESEQRFQHGRAAVHALLTLLPTRQGAGTTVPLCDEIVDPSELVAALIAPRGDRAALARADDAFAA